MEKILNSNIVESLKEGWKDFAFIVKCNDGPKELVRVIAEDRSKAEEYAKKMYAQNHTTYADDRYNEWYIEETVSEGMDESYDNNESVIRYPNGMEVTDVDLDRALDYQYGTDRNMDNSKYTDEEKQRAVTYWINKTNPNPYNESKVSEEDTQYGVHSFSQSSIIFRGTEEECAEFIADHNLWDDAEIYAMTPDDPHYLKEAEEDGLENATQEYTSANTSINSAKLPAIFSMVNFKPETINLDYGGGKFDNATTALEGKGVTNLIYDPYNRSSGHNKDVIDTVRKNGGADTVTCSNVLNVIKEPEARKAVIKNIYSLLKNSGTAYFTVYEGTGKGNEGPTKSGYQLNKKTGDYIEEISSVFPSVSRHGKLIIASKRTSVTEEFDDDWSDTLETGGEPTYCPDCGVKFVRDEEGDAICPKCNKTPYQLANERRKNESLNEDDIKYTATGRKKLVSDETMYRAVEAAKTVDPNAKRDYDDDFIYGDDGHGGSTWVILLNGDGKAYSTWGRNAVLTSKVEKAVNDAADAYWADFDKRWEENNKHLTAFTVKEAMDSSKFDKLLDKAFEFGYNYGYSDTFEDFMKKVKPNVKQSLTKDMLIRLKDAFDNGNHEGDVDEEMPLTENESLKESYLDNLKNPDYWQHQVDYQLEHFGRVGGGLIQDLDENGFYLNADNKVVKKLHENTIKTPKIEWTFIKSKEVEDSDGFLTDYTWYEGSDGTQVMVFGDNDIYKPEDGYFDVTFTDRKQAEDWFNSY